MVRVGAQFHRALLPELRPDLVALRLRSSLPGLRGLID